MSNDRSKHTHKNIRLPSRSYIIILSSLLCNATIFTPLNEFPQLDILITRFFLKFFKQRCTWPFLCLFYFF